jgi:predicted dehydrogenase
MPGVRLVAVCDADQAHLDKNLNAYRKKPDFGMPEGCTDFRHILDRQDIDAVCISTPNHWHSLMAIMACQAGKHVYVEKPISQTQWEGRKLVEAADRYQCLVQGGTQNRSDIGLREYYDWFKEGTLGSIQRIRGLCYRSRSGIGKQDTPLAPPNSLDYNLWLGPARDQLLYRPRFHYDWHWYWNTGNGDLGNQGPHEFNQILWTLGDFVFPTRVTSLGGRFGWHDAAETANMQICLFENEQNIPVIFEVRNMQQTPEVRAMPHFRRQRTGVVIQCEGGYFAGGRGGGTAYDNQGAVIRKFKGDGGKDHHANFIEALRQGKPSLLRSPIATNHVSDTWHHLANISYLLGTDLPEATIRERLQGDAVLTATYDSFQEHLANWSLDPQREPWTLGVTLSFDGKREAFTGPLSGPANALLRRRDRAPFIVPEKV